jgi:hypothetical protein
MTEQPDPEANRIQWKTDHPDAAEVSQDDAAASVAAQLGGAAPAAGVTDSDLGAQMASAGATAGLPYEDQMNAMMEQLRRMSTEIDTLRQRDQQREQAQVMALGEPILQRYANGLRDKLAATVAANPGSDQHFAQALADAGALAEASSKAIARGANDLGTVRAYAGRLDHFFDRGHVRTAQGHVRHVDLSSAAHDLEQVISEAHRLQPGAPSNSGAQAQTLQLSAS